MTIQNYTPLSVTPGTGAVLAPIPVPSPFFQVDDIKVMRVTAGIETLLSLNTDYTISQTYIPGSDPQMFTGTVNVLASVDLVSSIVTFIDPANEQTADLGSVPFRPSDYERQFDYTAVRDASIREYLKRSVRMPMSYVGGVPRLIPGAPGDFLSYSASGDIIPVDGATTGIGNMLREIYDPSNVAGDAFDFNNMRNANLSMSAFSSAAQALLAVQSVKRGHQDRVSILSFIGAKEELAKPYVEQDWRQVFERALSSGLFIYVPEGRYPIRSYTVDIDGSINAVTVRTDNNVMVECSMGARIEGKASLDPVIGGLFRIITATDSASVLRTQCLHWYGGIFDVSEVPADGSGLTILDTYWHKHTVIQNVIFDAGSGPASGENPGYGGGDTAFCPHRSSNVLVLGCKFYGFPDAPVYLTGNNQDYPLDGLGERYIVIGCYFERSNCGVTFKRSAAEIIVGFNHIHRCVNGIYGSPADGVNNNEGKGVTIIGNRLTEIQGRPIMAVLGIGDVVVGNHVMDFGKLISDPTQFTVVANFNWIGAIELRGCKASLVTGNSVGFRVWSVIGATLNKEPVGIVVKFHDNSDPDVTSDYNLIAHNVVNGAYRAFIEGAGADANQFLDNVERNLIDKPVLSGAASIAKRPLKTGNITVDIPSIPSGGTYDVAITVPGAALGDSVENVFFSRSLNTANGSLDWSAFVHAANTVYLHFSNRNAAAVDLANTKFTAFVRPGT